MCTSTRHTSSVPVMYNKWGFLSTSVTLCCLNESSYKESTMLLNMEPKCRERSSKPLNLFIYFFVQYCWLGLILMRLWALGLHSYTKHVVFVHIPTLVAKCSRCTLFSMAANVEQLLERMLMSSPQYVLTVHTSIVNMMMCSYTYVLSIWTSVHSLCLLLSVVLVMLCDCKHQTCKISSAIIYLIGLMLPNCLSAMKSFVYWLKSCCLLSMDRI